MRVLDLACGSRPPRHRRGPRSVRTVVAVDRDPDWPRGGARGRRDAPASRSTGRRPISRRRGRAWGIFDAVLLFNYLDRPRMPRVLDAVRPGGILLMETLPHDPARARAGARPRTRTCSLPGELARLVAPLEIVLHGREVAEPVDDASAGVTWRVSARALARS